MKVPSQKIFPEGPEFSRIILGGWRWNDRSFPISEQEKLIDTALELGITSFDHADIYGNYNCQYLFGKVLKNNQALRDKIEIITKCDIKPISGKFPERLLVHYDTSKEHIIESAEESLRALNVDYVDTLLIHRPDPLMDADIVAEAFTQLKDQGKVKYFGVSNFSNAQFSLLQSRLGFPLVTNQLEISMSFTDLIFDGTLDYMQEKRVGIMAWSPFGGGKIFNDKGMITQLNTFAKRYSVSVSAIIIAWLLRHPGNIFPVVGTMKTDRLREIAKASEIAIELQDWFMLLKIARGYDVP
ncbi:MAG: aldo/keto reductase [Cyclobacteriaceae bacterium]|nr:aldo/keto reductase [Cyclobacteriaceae bacterium]